MSGNELIEFVENEWELNYPTVVMTSPRCGRAFDMSRGTAKHYLNRYVGAGLLMRVRFEHNVWYMLSLHREAFEQYILIGVVVE